MEITPDESRLTPCLGCKGKPSLYTIVDKGQKKYCYRCGCEFYSSAAITKQGALSAWTGMNRHSFDDHIKTLWSARRREQWQEMQDNTVPEFTPVTD